MGNYIIIIYFVLFSAVGAINYGVSRKYADKKTPAIPGSASHWGILLKMYLIIVIVEIITFSIIITLV